MDFSKLINQVLGGAKEYSGKAKDYGSKNADLISKIGGGTAAAGLLSVLFGRKKGKGMSWVQAGSMAALGALAYHGYQKYQESQKGAKGEVLDKAAFTPNVANEEQNSRVILRALIAAAAANGEIDAAERALILQENGGDVEAAQWLEHEAKHPVGIAELAQEVGSNTALAAEVYLAARMVCGEIDRKEAVFLSQLAHALNLDDKLVESLEKHAGF